MNSSKAVKTSCISLLGLCATIAIICTLPSCVRNNPSHDYVSFDYNSNNTLTSETTSNDSSFNSSTSSSDDGKNEDPEEAVEVKKRKFDLGSVKVNHIYDLFERMFKEVDLIATKNITLDSNDKLIANGLIDVEDPISNDLVTYSYKFETKGVLTFNIIDSNSLMPDEFKVDVADIFANYLNKENAVLIGKNNKNDFGIVKKKSKWYFEFLGLNIPLFNSDIDLRNEAILNSVGDLLVSAKVDVSAIEEVKNEDNAIPLAFYKHFANVLIDYNLTSSSQKLIDKATTDSTSKSFDYSILRSDLTLSDNLKLINANDKLIMGDSSYQTNQVTSKCLSQMFLESHPGFDNNDEFIINEDGILSIDNGSDYEGSAFAYIISNLNFFPFFNSMVLIPSSYVNTSYSNYIGTLDYADEIGQTALFGGIDSTDIDLYTDSKSHELTFDYSFTWSLTDAYYFIFDYFTSNAYFTSAKKLYADTFNELTKPSTIISDSVDIKNIIATDVTETSTTTLYGEVEKAKVTNKEVLETGFEIIVSGISTKVKAPYYASSITINGEVIANENYYYFFKEFALMDYSYTVRYYIEYSDKIVYSQWKVVEYNA